MTAAAPAPDHRAAYRRRLTADIERAEVEAEDAQLRLERLQAELADLNRREAEERT